METKEKIKVAFIGDIGVGKTMLFMRINNLLKNKDDYKDQDNFILQKEELLNTTNNGCLIQEKEIILENNEKYILEIWDISNTQKTMRFNRFPITRKFYFSNDAQILIFFIEPRDKQILETTKMLYDINKIKSDINSVNVLCITKNDLNYSEEELSNVVKFGKENNLEIIFSSSFTEDCGLNDDIFRQLIKKYNQKFQK